MALTQPEGYEGRRIFIDAVDEARARRKEPAAPRARYRRLVDLLIKQVKLVEKQQRIVTGAMRRYRGAYKTKTEKQEMSAEEATAFVKASRDITDQLTRLSEAVRSAQEHEKKQLAGLSHDELDDVLRLHLARSASAMSDAEKQSILTTWFGEEVTEVLLKHREASP